MTEGPAVYIGCQMSARGHGRLGAGVILQHGNKLVWKVRGQHPMNWRASVLQWHRSTDGVNRAALGNVSSMWLDFVPHQEYKTTWCCRKTVLEALNSDACLKCAQFFSRVQSFSPCCWPKPARGFGLHGCRLSSSPRPHASGSFQRQSRRGTAWPTRVTDADVSSAALGRPLMSVQDCAAGEDRTARNAVVWNGGIQTRSACACHALIWTTRSPLTDWPSRQPSA